MYLDGIIPIMSVLLISQMRKAIKDYDMIQNGDNIAVGLSGGKYSLANAIWLKSDKRAYRTVF
jgi:tRNA(Ile)-lysidine synthase TilS/MesJ